ncbi:MAG: Spy/CpxP family protein refolding chaperone [Syntrophales bacterium]|nr:Spy/CpxP family protein refolding chaperone [Syntrophales bacterium]
MKSTRKSIVVMAVVLAVVFAVSSMALARGYGRGGGGYCAGPGFAGPGSGGPGLGAIMGLNLSDSQRDQALKIMETYQIDMIKGRGELIKGRENLSKALQSDTFNEQDVRVAHKKLSSLREDQLVARAKMMTEMKAILTPEQVKLLDERTAERSDELESPRGYARPIAGRGPSDCPRW